MFESITVRRLTSLTVFKLIGIGTIYSFVPFGVLMGLLGALGAPTVQVAGDPVTGARALLMGPLVGLVAALGVTLWVGAACSFGLWLNSKFDVLRLDTFAARADADART